ncbi:MAG TPA: DUF4097 family beta strand repeat-containing protein [Acidobacteriota bacterium]|nr:DUF4097 family beta strand repeat-containing protein [Acidobacteriota bacterium]
MSISTWNRPEVVVRSVGLRIQSLSIQETPSGVRIGDPRGGGWHGDARLEINVPRQSDLDLRTSYGDISLRGNLKGAFRAVTSAGDIEFENVDGSCDVSTAGGDIEGSDITGDGDLRTSGGEIRVRDVGGTLEARTAGGEIRVGKVGGSLQARTAGGDVTADEVGKDADLSTSGGDVALRRAGGSVDLRTSGGDIELRESSGRARATTAGGDIVLRGVRENVRARTAGGDIVVELVEPSAEGFSDLRTQGGDVEIALPASAAVTIEATIRLRGWDDDDSHQIRSDFPAADEHRSNSEVRATYVLNGGGQSIRLESTDGSIRIRALKR